jgi:hypothetical protein
MNFDVSGPFVLKRFGKKIQILTKETKTALKTILDNTEGLADARGCYVFAIRASQGYTPHYVGQAAKQPVVDEAMSDPKLTIYNQVCANHNGSPVLFLLPMMTPTGRYNAGNQSSPALTFLERWLISQALEKNPNLYNTKETRYLRKLHVVGLFNATQGEATKQSRALSKALGL